ncbi:hypothetical protein B4099_1358 [Heyndrickxia coagulans]|uniref:Uncharacterized protein n=1 Tax=Heyndrickxia coagulans TaxID=1398 RepID=A0A150KF43_HEYCO|nr:hypothetical protein B4099_1358 [Heyndrickxia coagulans]
MQTNPLYLFNDKCKKANRPFIQEIYHPFIIQYSSHQRKTIF